MLRQRFPDIKIAPRAERDSLGVGDLVYLAVERPPSVNAPGERFWAQVTDVDPECSGRVAYVVSVSNDLYHYNLREGTRVQIDPRFIIQSASAFTMELAMGLVRDGQPGRAAKLLKID